MITGCQQWLPSMIGKRDGIHWLSVIAISSDFHQWRLYSLVAISGCHQWLPSMIGKRDGIHWLPVTAINVIDIIADDCWLPVLNVGHQ